MNGQQLTKIRVKVGDNKNGDDRSYDILIGHNTLNVIGNHIKKINIGDAAFIITSPKIGKLHLRPVLNSLKKSGIKHIVKYVRDGEQYKNEKSWKRLMSEIIKFNQADERKVFVLNLGGGVIGDLGGWVAAAFKRGIGYIQVPSTLLAFVDCGIGGKVGINFTSIKNQVGAIWQPKLVFGDLNLLKTLNKREIRSGLAEVVKYGAMSSPNLFEFIEDSIDKIFSLDKEVIKRIVVEGYSIKRDIVQKDELDNKDIRIFLNFGHTIGHAVEFASNFAYRHGEAISIGMVCANDIAVKLGLLDKSLAARIESLLMKIGLPVRIKNHNMSAIMDSFRRDKKFINGKNRFVLITNLGKPVIKEGISEQLIKDVIKKRFV